MTMGQEKQKERLANAETEKKGNQAAGMKKDATREIS